MQHLAYTAGRAAALSGRAYVSNPHQPHDTAHALWSTGYRHAKDGLCIPAMA